MIRRRDPGVALAGAAMGPLLVLITFTIPVATLTATATALGAGPAAQAWILSGMSVGAAAGLLGTGAIGDDHGRRRTFVAGALLLAGASAVGALAPNALALVIARILQGLGAAAILACGLGLVGELFPSGAARARATGVWAAAIGAGVAVGPILSAALVDVGGWRLPYLMTALGGIGLAAVARALLPESRNARARRIDWAGMLLFGLGVAALLSGLVEGRLGWNRLPVVLLLLAGLVLVIAFVLVERRIAAPMLDLALFRRSDFVAATVAALAAGAGVLSLVSFLPTFLERAMGDSALIASALLLAWSATSVVVAFSVGWLPARITPRAQLIIGLAGAAASQLALVGLAPQSSIGRPLAALLAAGVAYGILNAALGHQAVSSVPAGRTAMGSGANNTARYLGSAIGLAVVAVVVTHAGTAAGVTGLLSGWTIAALVTAGFSLLGALVVFLAGSAALHAGGGLARCNGRDLRRLGCAIWRGFVAPRLDLGCARCLPSLRISARARSWRDNGGCR